MGLSGFSRENHSSLPPMVDQQSMQQSGQNVALMKACGKIVLLTATPEAIYDRVKHSTDRPVLNGNMNVEYIAELMEKRRPKYEAAADIVISTDMKNVREICEEILEKINRARKKQVLK